MKTLQMIHYFNFVIATVFVVFYFYQIGYLLLGLLMKHRKNKTGSHQFHRYAAVISARNEANVIGGLIASLKAQNYPSDLLDIYVIADNCTDNTAQVAAQAGARVYRRYNHQQVGKGYALDYLFKCLSASGKDVYDGYFVFDADNYVDPDFVKEMNATFDSGHFAALTSYRNSKNFGANWISAGYGLWFLREARFLNFPRMLLGTNCAISGTGFCQDNADLRLRKKGWEVGLIDDETYHKLQEKERMIQEEIERVEHTTVGGSAEVQSLLESQGSTLLKSGTTIAELIRRPELNYHVLAPIDKERQELPEDVCEQVEINIKYDGYIRRQMKQVEQFKKLEQKKIPEDIDYEDVGSLRIEARQKLESYRPISIGQASRISGVSPADISVLLVYLESRSGNKH